MEWDLYVFSEWLVAFIKDWLPVIKVSIGTFLGTFLGALVGFFISYLMERHKRNYERWRRHHNAMVDAEYRLNSILDIIDNGKVKVRNVITIYATRKKELEENNIIIWDEPLELPVDMTKPMPLQRQILQNELFSYDRKLCKLNGDIRIISKVFSDMRELYLKKSISKENYIISIGEYANRCQTLWVAYEQIDKKTKFLQARLRVTRKIDGAYLNKVLFNIPKPQEITKEQILEEQEILQSEIKTNQDLSKQETEELKKSMK
ncbi:MAG: hypothetical protein KAR42_13075 [candidate division Zixibacteria bacterium]|nr:hypothetical protein [candidate division Zixibacteria bacterium]